MSRQQTALNSSCCPDDTSDRYHHHPEEVSSSQPEIRNGRSMSSSSPRPPVGLFRPAIATPRHHQEGNPPRGPRLSRRSTSGCCSRQELINVIDAALSLVEGDDASRQ